MNDISNCTPSGSAKLPKSTEAIIQMFNEAGIKEYEPQLILQMTDLAHSLTKRMLVEAQSLAEFAGKKHIDKSDIQFTINAFKEKYSPSTPSKTFLAELADKKNAQPLLPMRQNFGLRLPNDRFCQVQPNFAYASDAVTQCSAAPNAVNGALPKKRRGSDVAPMMSSLSAENAASLLNRQTNNTADDEYD